MIIEDIDRLIPRRNLVRALVRAVANLGVSVIAEGIESEDVARACEHLGCDLGQGFLFDTLATCEERSPGQRVKFFGHELAWVNCGACHGALPSANALS